MISASVSLSSTYMLFWSEMELTPSKRSPEANKSVTFCIFKVKLYKSYLNIIIIKATRLEQNSAHSTNGATPHSPIVSSLTLLVSCIVVLHALELFPQLSLILLREVLCVFCCECSLPKFYILILQL